MKTFFLSLASAIITLTTYAQSNTVPHNETNTTPVYDTAMVAPVKLQIDGENAYYQKTITVNSKITENMIYQQSLEFFAAKNFQQNYGDEEEGKLIYTSTQYLNNNDVSTGYDDDNVDPFSVQFAITVDMKSHRYRYAINNVVFFLPTESGDRRLTLYDMYLKSTNPSSKRAARDATKLIHSFEEYITTLTNELYYSVEQKVSTNSSNF